MSEQKDGLNDTGFEEAGGGDNPARPGGQQGGAAGADMDPIGMESARPGPIGASGGGQEGGPAANGSLASGTYNERGDVTGPDSPAGAGARLEGDGQGDDLANRLGGGEGRAGLTGAGGATGSLEAGRSERTEASGAPSGGDPGGMGGARTQGGTGTGRPPGGVSPLGSGNDGN